MNSISIGIIPLFERNVRFADIKEIKFEPELRVVTNSDAYRIYTGVYPFGLDASSLKKQLLSYGNCTSEVDGECVDLQFAWP
ncbi:hypothetical protein [Oleiphilus messinensis]|nr:hypothetical protein [Oleiphilus messinensis]